MTTHLRKRIIFSDFENLASASVVNVGFDNDVDAEMRVLPQGQKADVESTRHCSPEDEPHRVETSHDVDCILMEGRGSRTASKGRSRVPKNPLKGSRSIT